MVGGYDYQPGIYHTGNNLTVKFDKYGTFQWFDNPWWSPYDDKKALVCLNDDNTFTVLTSVADSLFAPEYDYSRIAVIKFTQNGEEVWKKRYGESIPGNFVYNIKTLPDHGYICVGGQTVQGKSDIEFMGWILRLNSYGDSIWFRRYYYSEGYPFRYNSFRDIDLASDGGFIVTGFTYDFYPNDIEKIWVLKVDSIGCDTAGCDPTVGVPEEEKRRGGEGENQLVLWPNPASNIVNCQLSVVDF